MTPVSSMRASVINREVQMMILIHGEKVDDLCGGGFSNFYGGISGSAVRKGRSGFEVRE
jgi:hypothetical protein